MDTSARFVWCAYMRRTDADDYTVQPCGKDFFVIRCIDAEDVYEEARRRGWDEHRLHWDGVGKNGKEPTLKDCFEMTLSHKVTYGVDHNTFVIEMVKVPAFRKFLKEFNPHSVVSNPMFGEGSVQVEAYSPDEARKLERVLSDDGVIQSR